MTKHRSHKRRTHTKKSRTMRHRQHGGELAGNPPSAWGWGMGTLGNGWTQFMNSLTLQPGQNTGTNVSVPVGNLNAQTTQGNIPSGMGGGKRRRHRKSLGKRGGNVGAILSQAAVPGALMAGLYYQGRRSRRRKFN